MADTPISYFLCSSGDGGDSDDQLLIVSMKK